MPCCSATRQYSTLHSPWMSNTCQVCVIHWSSCSATRGCSLFDFSQFNREVSISEKYNQLPLFRNQRVQRKYYSRVREKMKTIQSPTDLLSLYSVQCPTQAYLSLKKKKKRLQVNIGWTYSWPQPRTLIQRLTLTPASNTCQNFKYINWQFLPI